MKNLVNKFLFRFINVALFSLIFIFFALTSYIVINAQNIPQIELSKLLVKPNGTISQALFSPDNDIQTVLVNMINQEKEGIKIAIFCFTQKATSNALLKAQERGVKIEIVADREFAINRASKVPFLANHRMPIWVFQNDQNHMYTPLMHDKFIIFKNNFNGKPLLWTGSYNFTLQANERNQENVIITDDIGLIDSFEKQFEVLKSRSLQISGPSTKYGYIEQQTDTNTQGSLPILYYRYLKDIILSLFRLK